MRDKIQKLIAKYSKDIELLKQGDYAETTKVQTVCVLREVIEDLKVIVKEK